MKKTETYQTKHPTIKEITIGDKYITECGRILTFMGSLGTNHPFLFKSDTIDNTSFWFDRTLLLRVTNGRGKIIKIYKMSHKIPNFGDKVKYL